MNDDTMQQEIKKHFKKLKKILKRLDSKADDVKNMLEQETISIGNKVKEASDIILK
jgi:hypothetical protein